MDRLICLMGKSSTGKDSLYRMLLLDKTLELRPLVLYTTRPIRRGEVDGQTYHFVTESRLDELRARHRTVESREYHTIHGPWRYCTLDDGCFDAGGDLLVIAAPEALLAYLKAFGEERVLPLYIQVDDRVRLLRAIDRESRQAKPKYTEVCRRFLADERDFQTIESMHSVRRYENDSLQRCFEALRSDLQKGAVSVSG